MLFEAARLADDGEARRIGAAVAKDGRERVGLEPEERALIGEHLRVGRPPRSAGEVRGGETKAVGVVNAEVSPRLSVAVERSAARAHRSGEGSKRRSVARRGDRRRPLGIGRRACKSHERETDRETPDHGHPPTAGGDTSSKYTCPGEVGPTGSEWHAPQAPSRWIDDFIGTFLSPYDTRTWSGYFGV